MGPQDENREPYPHTLLLAAEMVAIGGGLRVSMQVAILYFAGATGKTGERVTLQGGRRVRTEAGWVVVPGPELDPLEVYLRWLSYHLGVPDAVAWATGRPGAEVAEAMRGVVRFRKELRRR